MLHIETVEPGTLSILKSLMAIPALKNFALVGGTALSLKYGHRTSVDLDIFSHQKFDNQTIEIALKEKFGKAFSYEDMHPKFGIFCYVDSVKIDIAHYPHALIAPIEDIDIIPMYNSMDIAAIKIQAILGRGRKKDFWHIEELLKHFSLHEIMGWHDKKFPDQMFLISIPEALTYFTDADDSEDPVSLKGQTWESVKGFVSRKVSDYLKY